MVTQLTEPLADPSASQVAIFWAGRVLGVLASFSIADHLVERWLADRWERPPWLKPVVAGTLIATVFMTLIEMGLEQLVPQRDAYDDSSLSEVSMLLALAVEYVTIASMLLPVNLVLWLLIDARREPAAEAPPPAAAEPAFLAKTSGIGLDDVIALGAEEHYVRVYTLGHSELIHYRLGDAVEEMPGTAGMRVHRSWWVADHGVAGARRKTRRWELRLSGDLRVPVSDSFVAKARERGYLRKRPARSPNATGPMD